MRIKLWQAILLALVASFGSVMLYRGAYEGDATAVVVVEPPPPVPAVAPLLPPPVPVAREPAHVPRLLVDADDRADPAAPEGQCPRCEAEWVGASRGPGDLAHLAALDQCVARSCPGSGFGDDLGFEAAVMELREHRTEPACARLARIGEGPEASPWTAKAQNLFARRCDR